MKPLWQCSTEDCTNFRSQDEYRNYEYCDYCLDIMAERQKSREEFAYWHSEE